MALTAINKEPFLEELAKNETTLAEWREKQARERRSIESLTAQIQQLQSQLRNHRQSSSAASMMVRTLELVVRQQRADLFPVMTVPDDVLSIIFEAVRTDVPDVDADPAAPTVNYHMGGSVAVARVAAVSRRWRAVALRTPRIWSTINIPPLNQPGARLAKARAISWLEERVSRSGSAPLSISFLCVDEPKDKAYAAILRTLAKRTTSWQHLAAVCQRPFPELWKYLVGPLPALKSIVVSASSQNSTMNWDPWFHWPAEVDDKPRYLSLAPNLREVSLYSVPPMWLRGSRAACNWSSIQSFDIAFDWDVATELWATLACMISLTSLRLETSQPRIFIASPPTAHDQIELLLLRHLSLVGPFAPSLLISADASRPVVIAPSLRTVLVEKCLHSVPHLGVLLGGLQSVDTIEMYHSNLATIPDLVPSLRPALGVHTFIGDHMAVSGALLHALADTEDVMWPGLEHIEFRGVQLLGTASPRLAELVRARSRAIITLKDHLGLPSWVNLKSILVDDGSLVEECDRASIRAVAELDEQLFCKV
ncbi:hypothetical protein BKA62DRAFT_710881 [Auriculariales sp. MPI-PUGE-AT-0066]|nr:hypothetical protein BKA62DRAFT_710881 [Auriculariales sp. MPI-PUGE-AT-0066]